MIIDQLLLLAQTVDNKMQQSQNVEYTDFPAEEATLWVEGNVILLPSEH